MIETLSDVVQELSRRYGAVKHLAKRGEKGDVFLSIIKRLFYEYGEYFGFETDELSAFKSEVIKVRNNLRKTKRKHFVSRMKKYFRPAEGDGEIFTMWQIEAYGLNADTYY